MTQNLIESFNYISYHFVRNIKRKRVKYHKIFINKQVIEQTIELDTIFNKNKNCKILASLVILI